MGGEVTVSGPLKTPQQPSGTAEVSDLDLVLQGVELKSAGPLRIGLKNGNRVDGPGAHHRAGHRPDARGNGAGFSAATSHQWREPWIRTGNGEVSVALKHTLDPDLLCQREGGVHGGRGRAGEEAVADRAM